MKSVHEQINEERFWAKVDKSGECWQWTGGRDRDGYGRFWLDGWTQAAHRVSYIWSQPADIDGFQLDHVCHNKSCVRPDHLRPVDNKQNQENRSGAQRNSSTGVRGVSWKASNNGWVANVGHDSKIIYLGIFGTIAEAEKAVIAKRLELFTHNELDRVATA